MNHLLLTFSVLVLSACAPFSSVHFPGHEAFVQAARLPL